ncbi:hypothetical protein [Aestuariibaculum lutulentum]|uniref:Methyltransferase domain-containing protein n=1 Tax=Aestuariibaculum lutulentum TaxID=2920935 RepID=A0ABS9RGL6_9FLAO|nr:hypothetical protein [Aestuariibaculum lutulentum]MCH4551232.1 hypothetical protein [Aestuariibaculum lutulentum]
MKSLKQSAVETYLEFSSFEGSQHIASQFAIYKTLQIIRKNKVMNILEIGLGIGTLPSAVLNYFGSDINYSGTEDNEFCLKSLKEHLKSKKIEIFKNLDDVNLEKKYDLLIIDGKEPNLKKIANSLSQNAVIIIEGDRMNQYQEILHMFSKSLFVHMTSNKKNHPKGVFDENNWQGGVKVFFINPTIKQKIYWFKEKLNTKFNYLKRKNF